MICPPGNFFFSISFEDEAIIYVCVSLRWLSISYLVNTQLHLNVCVSVQNSHWSALIIRVLTLKLPCFFFSLILLLELLTFSWTTYTCPWPEWPRANGVWFFSGNLELCFNNGALEYAPSSRIARSYAGFVSRNDLLSLLMFKSCYSHRKIYSAIHK